MNAFETHKNAYPHRQIEDDLKWIFQSMMGCEHFVGDEKKSLERIKSEMEGDYHYFIEEINEHYARFHFQSLTQTQAVVLNQLFIASSKVQGASKEELKEVLLEFSKSQTTQNQEFIKQYIQDGLHPISHSTYFKDHYNPHYRVLYKHYLIYFEALCKIYERDFHILAIDGRCGSGKSTLGKLVSDIYHCPLIAMDDFYLPHYLRHEERFNEPGGNVHYERFEKEVYENILKKQDFEYGVFSHKVMDVYSYKKVKQSDRYVIEGSYSFHPQLRKYSDFKIFLTQSKDSQKKRIIKRDGQKIWEMFENRWIPMEELYFNSEDIAGLADIIVDVSEE